MMASEGAGTGLPAEPGSTTGGKGLSGS